MDSFQALVLAFVQGITEFLPVSSSGHLILLPKLLGWEDQGLAFDVAVHVGTLLAVLVYFRAEIVRIATGTFDSMIGRGQNEDSRLGWQLVFVTIPVGLAGLLFNDKIASNMRDPQSIAIAMLVFAFLLWWVDKNNRQSREMRALNWKDIIVIGSAQAIALLPGVSRSGMTMAAALLMGLNRDGAARFSFLMSVPVILLAGALKVVEMVQSPVVVDWQNMMLGVAVSSIVAFVCIHWFLGFIRKFSLAAFSVYLILLGSYILFAFRIQ